MTRLNKLLSCFLLTILSIGLCGCPPLRHSMFLRNTTKDTSSFVLTYKTGNFNSKKNVEVKFKNELLDINNTTLSQLDGSLHVIADSNKVGLKIPPRSTVYVTNILDEFGMFEYKTLIITSADKADTMTFNYPYKRLHGFKYKRNKWTNFFYRLTTYYDIR
jgi:hypothetical protein